MEIRPIRTDEDHRTALAEIDACWGAAEGTEEGDRLDVLLAPAEVYEAKRWPMRTDESFDPIDVLGHAIEELGHTQAELAELLGSRSRASEILSRRRVLIHKISEKPRHAVASPSAWRCRPGPGGVAQRAARSWRCSFGRPDHGASRGAQS